MSYSVRVTRVNEGAHQNEEENYEDVASVEVSDEGRVSLTMEAGNGANFGPTTWGSVTIVRVAGR